ncbi:MAG: N-formylglutamate amidohydrolase [Candidatus Nitronauta litoralis]|uniref:N-formylglutamate amidohydrolase n=1 Tax=Candidatus Nitronauta litoralis TaxID=2705533 RepID=A0A7T0BTE8_9BACT|nr:MAG: N-formylglutamate amidohydrolase [Candidatus Nitronauta litoralis]
MKLPLLISIPHGGTKIPEEVSRQVHLSPKDLFEDSDSFTREIYGIKEDVLTLVETDIARAFIDLSRDITDRPPENPDGIVKTKTCHGHSIYSSAAFPDEATLKILVQKYYDPYHKMIEDTFKGATEIQLALDCHTMEPIGPAISPDTGKERPSICLGNNFGKSCPDKWVQNLSKCFQKSFNLDEGEITINEPFAGGYITRKYGNNPLPWVQIEMNRKMYLSSPWFDKNNRSVAPDRLKDLRESFREGLELFFS